MPRSTNDTPRLRGTPLTHPFHIVLVEPEIPPNTGNIARLCAGTQTPLHLVGKLGFRIDEHSVKRAGLDYWHLVELHQHPDFAHFMNSFSKVSPTGRLHLFSATASTSYTEANMKPGDALVFGKESIGLSEELLLHYSECAVAIPSLGPIRSFNLANAVSIALFEGLRGAGALSKQQTFMG